MNECIFCQIIEGKVPSKKIYEDEVCVGILDIRPLNKGHMLLIPKEHYQIAPQVPEPVIKHLGMISKKLSQASLRGFKAQGTNIFMANGAIAGQQMPHVVIHIIPRFDGDKVTVFNIPKNKVEQAQLDQMSQLLKEYIQKKSTMSPQEQATLSQPAQQQQPAQGQPQQEPQRQTQTKPSPEPAPQKKPQGGADLDAISKLF